MLLTLTNTTKPATDLGFLLHKNPARAHRFPLSFGTAHVFYGEASVERCTAHVLLDVDGVGLVRGGNHAREEAYVNDRPYVASSFMSVALSKTFGTALGGRCKDRPELVGRALELTASLPVVPCRGGEALFRRLFEPLGYAATAAALPLDERFPEWGDSEYLSVSIAKTTTLVNLLTHLQMLMPVMDDETHYWVAGNEVEALLRRGEGWLAAHPERELILKRALRHQGALVRPALERLSAVEEAVDGAAAEERAAEAEAVLERRIGLNEARMLQVAETLRQTRAETVIDLGCGEGKLLEHLLKEPQFRVIRGMDVAAETLQKAVKRLQFDRLPRLVRERIEVFQGSLVYLDQRLKGFDAAAIVEVIEHLEPERLAALTRIVFAYARPKAVVVTTPNAEYNALFPRLPAGKMRHADHRFEWTRAQFEAWANGVAAAHGYEVSFAPVGALDPQLGAPTQLALFRAGSGGEAPA